LAAGADGAAVSAGHHDLVRVVSQVELGVELGGLEPPTPCLQSMARLSSTVCGLARSGLLGPPESSNVQPCWCRLWVSPQLLKFS